MSKWLEGRVVENRHWTDALFSLRVQGVKIGFEAGQFVRIALEENLARPFSFVNPPGDPVLEFYGIVVPEGPLSPRLARLRAGDRLLVASNPAGFLVLSEYAEFLYKTTDFYAPEHERCIRWDDPTLAIDWPLQGLPTLSVKDQQGKSLQEAELFDR